MSQQRKNRPDSQPLPVLAMDIGNTRAHIGLILPDQYRCLCSSAFPTRDLEEKLYTEIIRLSTRVSLPVPGKAALSSVVSSASDVATDILTRNGISITGIGLSAQIPLAVKYKKPEELGTDRIANALYCIAKYPGRNLIVISAGTALTVDCLVKDSFQGGAILPGISLQLRSLGRAADALPDLSVDSGVVPELPGTSTGECIMGGVLHGTAASISGIINKYIVQCGCTDPVILATGGDWKYISSLVSFRFKEVPHLTLIGTACIFRYR